jgi:hypothetical protein
VQKIVNLICARPLQHRLFKYLLDEIDAHCGDLILCTEVHWLSREKVLFRFQELPLLAVMEFLQNRDDLSPQLKDSQWLLDTAFLTDCATKLNESNTELHGENRAIIKMIGTINSFKGKKLWKTQLMKGVLTHFPSVQSCANNTFDASIYILCIDKLLNEFGRRFKDFECMKCTVSFITNPF